MLIKIVLLSCFLCFLTNEVKSQDDSGKNTGYGKGDIYLSITGGLGLSGPKGGLEDNMKASGFSVSTPAGWLSTGPTVYPEVERLPVAMLDAAYFYRASKGVAVTIGLIDNLLVKGNNNRSKRLDLKSEIWMTSTNYILRSEDKKNHFAIGPALFLHTVKDKTLHRPSQSFKNIKPGLNAAYSLHFLQGEKMFLALNLSARWAPESEVGPIIVEDIMFIDTPEPVVYKSEFRATKVQLAGFQVGVVVGFKLDKKDT